MKLLTGLFAGLFLVVFGGIVYAQNFMVADTLVGEWEFVSVTIMMNGASATRESVGSVKVDANSFSGQWNDANAPTTLPQTELSGMYALDQDRDVVVVLVGVGSERAERLGFKYRLIQKNDGNYLELEFSFEDTFSKEELDSFSSDTRETFENIE